MPSLFSVTHDKHYLLPAVNFDKKILVTFIDRCDYIHRHLDWHKPTRWFSEQPFWVELRNQEIIAMISCPVYPTSVVWIRLFANNKNTSIHNSWKILWSATWESLRMLQENGFLVNIIAAIPIHDWFTTLLRESGFYQTNQVITLAMEQFSTGQFSLKQNNDENWHIRKLRKEDIPQVVSIDWSAFSPLWRYTDEEIELALSKNFYSTVYVDNFGMILAYQITTLNLNSGHLSRIAVHPKFQSQGIGTALIKEIINKMEENYIDRITVNTQTDNQASLALYIKNGFKKTKEVFPVYTITDPFI
jgi:ribosomal-protein-alanine N-acetyltransferase